MIANNYQALMTRIARDKDRKIKEHRPFLEFLRGSCSQVAAGGQKSYMKPQCLVSSNDQSGNPSD